MTPAVARISCRSTCILLNERLEDDTRFRFGRCNGRDASAIDSRACRQPADAGCRAAGETRCAVDADGSEAGPCPLDAARAGGLRALDGARRRTALRERCKPRMDATA